MTVRRGFDVARLAHRRMGHSGFKIALNSLFGKMLFASVMKDLEIVYRQAPQGFSYAEKSSTRIAYTRLGDGHFRYDFDPGHSWIDSYQIGLIEGLALQCGFSTQTRVHLTGPYHGSLESRWF